MCARITTSASAFGGHIFFLLFLASTDRSVSLFGKEVVSVVCTGFSEPVYVIHCEFLGWEVIKPGCAEQVAYYQVWRGGVGRQYGGGGGPLIVAFPWCSAWRAGQSGSRPQQRSGIACRLVIFHLP